MISGNHREDRMLSSFQVVRIETPPPLPLTRKRACLPPPWLGWGGGGVPGTHSLAGEGVGGVLI
jgi:hypothetical protein